MWGPFLSLPPPSPWQWIKPSRPLPRANSGKGQRNDWQSPYRFSTLSRTGESRYRLKVHHPIQATSDASSNLKWCSPPQTLLPYVVKPSKENRQSVPRGQIGSCDLEFRPRPILDSICLCWSFQCDHSPHMLCPSIPQKKRWREKHRGIKSPGDITVEDIRDKIYPVVPPTTEDRRYHLDWHGGAPVDHTRFRPVKR